MRSIVFFFQAEDGIRDLVRSRGLGDVYKRQDPDAQTFDVSGDFVYLSGATMSIVDVSDPEHPIPVSYTHLTLPTSDLV